MRLELHLILMVVFFLRIIGRLAVLVGFIAIVLVRVGVVVRVVVILLGLIDLSDIGLLSRRRFAFPFALAVIVVSRSSFSSWWTERRWKCLMPWPLEEQHVLDGVEVERLTSADQNLALMFT